MPVWVSASRMTPEAARLIVERNLRPLEGGYAWRSDPRLTLPSHLRLTEETVQSLLLAIVAPVLVIAAGIILSYLAAGLYGIAVAATTMLYSIAPNCVSMSTSCATRCSTRGPRSPTRSATRSGCSSPRRGCVVTQSGVEDR